ncbi:MULTISPECIES: tRNA (guanosine(37)-N1)-methyltransferase TrmD [unclassified Enterococcus]|uniref:tRNA (guanosine(37)-N1)-methyltransferase TrmD n=1 Tax=unclassified Enterococcus TaxID=2608891 RepID=UPI001558206F|nr:MULTISPECIES: tRNA (guanosine(37)-N1)-methyltransferase TrmD [unclassified Enterococcus]MBS7577593.1 tRNA (guanosine(37)-N1)-methyltransferase TrmD [Enterococcus sp. MMGLQ5-2]MBS7584908.1 tRNA (guanosine(37)-N1)-methyltransferase TrmD [Enterococcus sp. MMGLQ5-1]NPD12763.1 tRNA (guanosine(37)-N1)-methyltransferase TrmD [Enterococcus sp. MMGLQ5-1]NPD37426.1 tRNA (guanosine(37)-N1)-methyltransferase TrmD [Enterococcus sp. MMGLQ5-2]
MKIDILTIFPEMFDVLNHSMIGKAQEKGLVELETVNFRQFATNNQKHVDDYPYGGGEGMLLLPQPIFDAFESIDGAKKRVILMDPAGEQFTQKKAEEFALEDQLVFICGHYEGYDERIKTLVTDEISLGDFVLTGGEMAAISVIDATVRLIPEVLGQAASHQNDSFSSGLLEYPQYTRPASFKGMSVPEVLTSGNHEKIRQWRLRESLRKTKLRRPDLLENYSLSDEMKQILAEIEVEKG